MTVEQKLKEVDKVIAQGPYDASWESLCHYPVPQWYQDAKFGIFIHWGVYSVPAFSSEWYPRFMYDKERREYEHHIRTYGPQKEFGYKDFIPMFKAEHFNADEWMDLFEQAGAKYVMPVAEHHDGFQMYESELSRWNAKNMGPCRDVIGELKQAADKRGLVFCLSNHRAEHCWFFNKGLEYDSDVTDPAYEDFYGKQQEGGDKTQDIYVEQPSEAHLKGWLARACEMVDKYRPQVVWFDWWIQNIAFKPYIKKFAAYYYNRAVQWGLDVAINYKYQAYAFHSAVLDIERGALDYLHPRFWQTDTAIATNSWGYTEDNHYKNPVDIVCDLVDIVSKNGCMLLNVGPKADGTITEEEGSVLLSVGEWLKRNGEGIYGTTYWQKYGEGPTKITGGYFQDSDPVPYTSEDIRFTFKKGNLYAFVMRYPDDGKLLIRSYPRDPENKSQTGEFDIEEISVLGYEADVTFSQDSEGLHIQVKGDIKTDYPVCLKIKIN